MWKLLLPRADIGFTQVDGGVKFYAPDIPDVLQRPLTKRRDGNIEGKESGTRSGLLSYVDKMYQIKACDVPKSPPYLRDGKDHGYYFVRGSEPNGGQFLRRCIHELNVVEQFSDIVEREGFVPPQRSVGYYIYNLNHYIRPVGAPIFESRGDTRLDELLVYLEAPIIFPYLNLHVPELYDLFYKLGFWAGRSKRVMDNHRFTWDNNVSRTNAYLANYAVFKENDEMMVGIVDLDSATRWRNPTRMKRVQEFEYKILLESILTPDIGSKNWADRLNGYVITSSSPVLSGVLEYKSVEYPLWYREKMKEGFEDGYKNPYGECRIEPHEIDDAIKAGEEALKGKLIEVTGKKHIVFKRVPINAGDDIYRPPIIAFL